jgi:hypothetical protein
MREYSPISDKEAFEELFVYGINHYLTLLSAKRNKSFLERLKDIPRIAAVF